MPQGRYKHFFMIDILCSYKLTALHIYFKIKMSDLICEGEVMRFEYENKSMKN